MKLYDFHCNHCDKDFEDLVSNLSDARCPVCSAADVTRQLSAFAVGGSSRDSGGGGSYGGGCGGGGCGAGSCGLG